MLDTEGPAITAWVKAARVLGRQVDEAVARKTIGINEAASRAILVDAYGPDFPYEAIRKELFNILFEEGEKNGISQKPGLVPLLDHLDSLHIPLAVATSTARQVAEWRLSRGGIRDRFPVMVFGDDISRSKPAPDIFLLAAQKLGKVPADCLGFEDSPAGLQALHAAGIKSIFVKDLVEPSPEVLATVWRRCGDLAEAIGLITPSHSAATSRT
ncbi:haloacid dehalogenase [Spirochaetia bacterium]|nr:haloacid dehalogenase [Spirochaetia bacterium]